MVDLKLGDCLEVMKSIPSNSVDSIVSDPPYGISFMARTWDYDVPSVEIWREALRVLKPGGHLLSFSGTRTYHMMAIRIENAGFEIFDMLSWIYGSGFPKSLDVSKSIDKWVGAKRKVVGQWKPSGTARPSKNGSHSAAKTTADCGYDPDTEAMVDITEPASPAAQKWSGWGTALKPACEPIALCQKPLEDGLTIIENVLKWGTGALNIDGGRIAAEGAELTALQKNWDRVQSKAAEKGRNAMCGGLKAIDLSDRAPTGRWPANILLDEEAAAVLDEQSGIEASRFFYISKASKRERNAGLEGMPEKRSSKMGAGIQSNVGNGKPGETSSEDRRAQNHHPTVKPIKLMEYLCKLITPPGGIVLDPFMGSGTTGVAAQNLGLSFVGIEREREYFEIAKRRIEAARKGKK